MWIMFISAIRFLWCLIQSFVFLNISFDLIHLHIKESSPWISHASHGSKNGSCWISKRNILGYRRDVGCIYRRYPHKGICIGPGYPCRCLMKRTNGYQWDHQAILNCMSRYTFMTSRGCLEDEPVPPGWQQSSSGRNHHKKPRNLASIPSS